MVHIISYLLLKNKTYRKKKKEALSENCKWMKILTNLKGFAALSGPVSVRRDDTAREREARREQYRARAELHSHQT